MLQSSFVSAEQDMKLRALREQQVEADRMIEATRAALAVDGDLLHTAERQDIDTLVNRLIAVRAGDDLAAIRAGVDSLARGTEIFAGRRMDRSVAKALAGRKVDDVAP